MADEQRILAHIEDTEYVKEIARQTVVDLLATSDIEEMLNSPSTFVDELLAAILVALDLTIGQLTQDAQQYAIDLGLAALDDAEAAEEVDRAKQEFLGLATPALLAALTRADDRIQAMIESGTATEVVQAALKTEATQEALLGSFESAAKSYTAMLLTLTERYIVDRGATKLNEQLLVAGQQALFTWIAVMDRNTCHDVTENSCRPRHGSTLSLDDWTSFGRPRSPVLLCCVVGPRCRCELMAAQDARKLLNPIAAGAAIRAGRERARAVRSA